MTLVIETKPVPLRISKDGIVLVTGTRIPVDTIIHAYHHGDTAEEIVASYDVLKLADVYAVLSYYLDHQKEVDAYLQRRAAESEAVHRFIDEQFDQEAFRQRLLILRERDAKAGG
ncbi:MAG: DUF433 domain-containing protein [Anaerolinea sp.]|nr:DUF433 domain-containing protein [Anaerolinea sp.]